MTLVVILVLTACFLFGSLASVQAPTWSVNPLLNSGQFKAVNSTRTPSTFPITQPYHTAFTSATKVVLSLEGYRQSPPCVGCGIGFKSVITSTSTSGFTANITVYGVNMFYLFYMYLGISVNSAEYFSSYNILQFNSGNLVDTATTPRSVTQVLSVSTGQVFTNYPVNQNINTVFLAGFKMDVGTTGTYINLTSAIVSGTTYSITISTKGDVKIYQVSYFRISFDKTTVTKGFVSFFDLIYVWGANSTQLPSTSTITSGNFQYRNYLMGLNQINIATTTQNVDIVLQVTPSQIFFTFNFLLGSAAMPTFQYVYADLFHQRRRVCTTLIPFYHDVDKLCYDICPQGYFGSTPLNYCQKCHYSCKTCNGILQTNCLTCVGASEFRSFISTNSTCSCLIGYYDAGVPLCSLCSITCEICSVSSTNCLSCLTNSQFRILNTSSNSCICINGYYENLSSTGICGTCDSTCLTCQNSATFCTSCDTINLFRLLNSTSNTCYCQSGYFQDTSVTPPVCRPCDNTCLTCSGSASSCLSCDSVTHHRSLNTTTSSCVCQNGFFETQAGVPLICSVCDSTCLTCQSSATFCTSCDSVNLFRLLNSTSNACYCQNGYLQDTSVTPSVCHPCANTCLTCSGLASTCLTCDSLTHHRLLNSTTSSCICQNGFFETQVGVPLICSACDSTCLTCQNSATFCTSCDSVNLFRLLNLTSNTCSCQTGYFQDTSVTPSVCRPCASTCITCSGSAGTCLSCDSVTHRRSLNTTTSSCVCQNGFFETQAGVPLICSACDSKCLTCQSSGTFCTSCDAVNLFRQLNSTSNTCDCQSGYFEDTSITPPVCRPCASTCITCSGSAGTCLSCDSLTHHRLLNTTTSSCVCQNGFFETQAGVPLICSACDSTCLTCQSSTTFCTSCDAVVLFRQLNSTSNTCYCQNGYFQDTSLTPSVCRPCVSTCLTCSGLASTCLTCDSLTHHRLLNSTTSSCICQNGFFETQVGVPLICSACDSTCLTCQNSATFCTSCDSVNLFRLLNLTSNTCSCQTGYFQDTSVTPPVCRPCANTCITCSGSAGTCLSCDSVTHLRSLNSSANICSCISGYFQNTLNAPICQLCAPSCLSCLNISSNCTSCDTITNFRILDVSSQKCICKDGYYQNSINSPLICLACDLKCKTCINNSTNCQSCNVSIRTLVSNGSTGTCICNTGTSQSSTVYGQCTIASNGTAICGNGVIENSQECDDDNLQQKDGCSSICKVQQSHKCDLYPNGTSLCYYNQPLSMNIESVLKNLDDNKINIVIKLQAPNCNLAKLQQYLDSLTAIQLSSARRLLEFDIQLQPENQGRILQSSTIIYVSSVQFNVIDSDKFIGYLNLVLQYTQSIQTLNNKRLSFLSSSNADPFFSRKYFYSTPVSIVQLKDPDNKVPMTFYQASSYKTTTSLSYVFLAINCINMLYFLIMMVFRKSAIPIQNILIYQFAYFCIIGLKQVELAIASLGFYGKFSTGVNINIISSNLTLYNQIFQYNMCSKMTKLYQQCNSIDNINITFYLATLTLILGFAGLIFKRKKQMQLDAQQANSESNSSNYNSSRSSNSNRTDSNYNSVQISSKRSKHPSLVYELPEKIGKAVTICFQFSFGIYFMTATEYLLTAVNQNQQAKIISIVWLAVIGVFFVFLWFNFFFFHPIPNLSYTNVLKTRIQKISSSKIFYVILFTFLIVWGVILGIAPGIASYAVLILWAFVWLYFSLRKKIYTSRILIFRSVLNQIYIIAIAVNYIVLDYAVNDGLGLICAIVILVVLLTSTFTNIAFYLYDIYVQRLNQRKLKQNVDQFKQVQSSYKKTSSRGSERDRNQIQMTVKKQPLMMSSPNIYRVLRPDQINKDKSKNQLEVVQNNKLNEDEKNQLIQKQVQQLKQFKKGLKINGNGEQNNINKQAQFNSLHFQSIASNL